MAYRGKGRDLEARSAHILRQALPVFACFGGGSLYGWSGFAPAVQAAFGISSAAVSMVFSISIVCFTIGALLGPVLLRQLRPKARLPGAVILAVAGLGLAALARAFWGFTTGYGVIFGFASGALYTHAVALAAATVRPMLLVPITVAAFGLGGAVFGPICVWLTSIGWSIWSMLPALIWLAGVAVIAVAAWPCAQADDQKAHVRTGLLMPDRTILKLWGMFAASSCAGLVVLGLAPRFLSDAQATASMIGGTVLLVALGNTLGRLSAAFVAGRCEPQYGITGALLVSAGALCLLLVSGSFGVIALMLFLVALSYGHIAAQTPLLVATRVQPDEFSDAFGWVFTGWGLAGLVGPWGAGWILDLTGNLRLAVLACCLSIAFGLWLLSTLPPAFDQTERQ